MSKLKQLEAKLTVKQREAALLVVERELSDINERPSFDEIADKIGTSRVTLWEWRTRNKAFIEYVNLMADDFLESKRALVYRQLMRLIEGPQPSVKALDLYLRRHGLLTDRQLLETKDSGNNSNAADIQRELEELDELLAEDDN